MQETVAKPALRRHCFEKWHLEFWCKEQVKVRWLYNKAHRGSDSSFRMGDWTIRFKTLILPHRALTWSPNWISHCRDITLKIILSWRKLCDNSLHCKAPSFTKVLFSNSLIALYDKCLNVSGDCVKKYRKVYSYWCHGVFFWKCFRMKYIYFILKAFY